MRRPPTDRFRIGDVPPARYSFRTDADGRLDLPVDGPSLFEVLTRLDTLAVQTRHRYARLVHLGRPPVLGWDLGRHHGSDAEGALFLRTDEWSTVHGHLGLCPCCGSAGRIEVHDRTGAEALQLCPSSTIAVQAWADCLADLCARPAFGRRRHHGRPHQFPRVPESVYDLGARLDPLVRLLSSLQATATPVRVLLSSPAATQLRTMIPKQLRFASGLLTFGDAAATLQLVAGALTGLWFDPELEVLYLAGPEHSLLLTLAPAEGTERAWRQLLDEHFTGHP